jgi:FKBP-type peptidyl-prolyl cis-trans isomerase FkpA
MSKNYLAVAVGVVVLIVLAVFIFNKGTNKVAQVVPTPIPSSIEASPTASPSATITATTYKEIKTMDGLIIQDLVLGTGAEATAGKKITVNYLGTLVDGIKFDSSYGKAPFSFTLGAGEVIKGWDEGFNGMKVGGKRKLTIPPELGYGEAGAGGLIPPNATLIFEVELLGVE